MNRSLSIGNARRCLMTTALFVTLGAVAALVPAAVAAAEEGSTRRVLLLSDKPGDLFIERIKAEIMGVGLGVITRAPSGPFEEDARAQHAIAAIRLLPTRNGVEVWMADATSGRSLLRQIIIDERPEGPDQGLIALQTAELLRTSLFPKTPEPPAQPPPPSPAPPLENMGMAVAGRPAPPAAPGPSTDMGLQAGIGAILSPGGSGPEMQLWLSLHRFFGRHLGLAVDLSLPAIRATLEGPEGKAKISTLLAGLTLLARLHAGPSDWFLDAGLGTAVVRVGIQGEGVASLTSSSSSVLTGAAYARVDGGYAPTNWLRLGAHVLGGGAFDQLHLNFAGNDAGTWGHAFAAATLFAEVAW